MIEIEEILYRWLKGMSARKIAQSLSVSRNTVKKILSQLRDLGIKDVTQGIDFSQLKACLYELRQKPKYSSPAQDNLKSYYEQIKSWLCMPYMTVTQMVRLFKEEGKDVSETSLRRYIRKHFSSVPVSTVHLETIGGRQAQVDFAFVGMMKKSEAEESLRFYYDLIS